MTAAQPSTLRLELYDDPHSEYSAKVKIALRAKALSWTPLAVPCGTTRSPEFLAINPLGKLPVLLVTDHNGRREAIFESEVILEYLEDAFPDPPLLPAEPLARSKARLLSRYHDLYLEPVLRRLYPQVAPSVRNPDSVKDASAAFLSRLSELERLLHPNRRFALTDNDLTVADVGYPTLLHYAELIFPELGFGAELQAAYTALPRLKAWRDALWAHPAVADTLAELTPAAAEWVQRKLRS